LNRQKEDSAIFSLKIPDKIHPTNVLMYLFLYIAFFTSSRWGAMPFLAVGELIRFDRILLFGQANIYFLFAVLFALIVFFYKFGPHGEGLERGQGNYLKTVFWLYFIPVDILIYLTVYIKDVPLEDLGVRPIVRFFIFLCIVYYVQDVFFKYKKREQLNNILTALQVLILARCVYSIVKFLFGVGYFLQFLGRLRIGQENDFADLFMLLFIISGVRLLFEDNKGEKIRLLHYAGLVCTFYVIVLSFRRYLWVEFVVAVTIIVFVYNRYHRFNWAKTILSTCIVLFFLSSLFLIVGPGRITDNPYVGRLLTSLSLFNSSFESQYGTDTRHPDEIKEGWENVKDNWLLGVTPYGGKLMRRRRTTVHDSAYVHNAFIGVWLAYGLFGVIIFVFFYVKTLKLGIEMFFEHQHWIGLVLFTFIVCQLTKNIVWDTFIMQTNVTIAYIFLISWILKLRSCLVANE
jgi:hypothetical protein